MSNGFLRMIHKFCLALLMGVLLTGCGYVLEGTRLPENLKRARTISILPFRNQTNEPGLGRTITEAVKTRFLHDGRLRVSDSPDADIVIEGALRTYRLTPIGFTRADQVRRYRVVVRTRIRLRDNARDKLLIDQELESAAEFTVSSSIARSDSSRMNANQSAADSFSEDIVSLVLDGF